MDEDATYTVGTVVKCWYGERFGVITEMNRLTAKVRHIGGKQAGYVMVEKSYYTDVLELHNEIIPDLSGAEVKLMDWNSQEREGVVLAQDGPFILVRYSIKDGQQRDVWTDLGRVSVAE